MAGDKAETKNNRSGGAFSKVLDLVSAARMFFTEVKESILDHGDRLLRRVQTTFVIYLWISIGAVFILLGIFDLLIDMAGVPRGIVFSLGGILISLVAVIFLQAAKIKKTRR